MDSFSKKTLTTSRGFVYTYYVRAGATDKPTILLQHGFPDSAHLYQEIVPHIFPTWFPMIIPDLLGYGGTSKPTDPSFYSSKDMAAELIEICDAEGAKSIISLGHDWGSWMAQRVNLWHPDRVVGVILLNVAYLPPDQENPFDLQAALKQQEELFGHPTYAYWELFTAPDAPELVGNRLESFWTVMHGNPPDWMKSMFCVRGAMREFLEADKRVPLLSYAKDPKWKEEWIARMKEDGLAAPFQWYIALSTNVSFHDEKHIPVENLVINKPLLFVGCSGDVVCRTDFIEVPKQQGLVPKLSFEEIKTHGHWSPMEKPDEVGKIIASFLQNTTF